MLSNAYFLAKFRFDTAENEPAKNFAKIYANVDSHSKPRDAEVAAAAARAAQAERAERRARRGTDRDVPDWSRSGTRRLFLGKISTKCCSFSAVSAPVFAIQYAFFSIFQNLPEYPAEFF